jgi:hypothetical protein
VKPLFAKLISINISPLLSMDRGNLIGRATEIAEVVRSLAGDLSSQGIPEPSFEHGLPAVLQTDAPDSNALAARMKLLGLLDELRDLLTDPALLGSPELVSKRKLHFSN